MSDTLTVGRIEQLTHITEHVTPTGTCYVIGGQSVTIADRLQAAQQFKADAWTRYSELCVLVADLEREARKAPDRVDDGIVEE